MKKQLFFPLFVGILLIVSPNLSSQLSVSSLFSDNRSPGAPYPVAVRYAWADNPECNLMNEAGLPASPFHADDNDPQPVREGKKEADNVNIRIIKFQ